MLYTAMLLCGKKLAARLTASSSTLVQQLTRSQTMLAPRPTESTLMGAMAIHTGAVVYAADKIQWYNTYNGLKNGAYNFGIWEGQLWRFPPNGAQPTKVFGAPVEFDDVVAGHAP